MKTISTTLYVIASLTTITSLVACDKTVATADKVIAEKSDENVISLFNGKDLTGWKKVGGTGKYKVEDGCIVGFGENVKGNTFLRTEKTYTDFELTYEFKFDHLRGNSGLMFRANHKPDKDGVVTDEGRVYGYQCEGDNKKRAWTAGLYDEARRGWLFPTKVSNKKKELTDEDKKVLAFSENFTEQGNEIFKWDGWNTITIRCVGNHITTTLNGEPRVDFTDTDEEHDTREGFFGLQVHGGAACQVRWRNLKLVDLSKAAEKK